MPADPPSYSEALATGSPVMVAIMDWYSHSACNTPWATSLWYGVYEVTNSGRIVSDRTTGGRKWS